LSVFRSKTSAAWALRDVLRIRPCAGPGLLTRLFGGTLLALIGSSNNSFAGPRDIVETLATAYTNNPEILSAQRNIYATNEEIPIALQRFLPRLSATGEVGAGYLNAQRFHSTAPQDLRQRIRTMGLSLSQPIYDGQAIPGYRAAHALVLRARAQLLQAEEAVLQDAATSHINILRDREILRLRDAYLVLLRSLAAVTERLVESGDRTVGDLAQVRAQEARALSAQLQARRDIAVSEAGYLRAVTIPAGELAAPALRYHLPTTIDIAVAAARSDNSKVLLLRVDQTLARERAAQSAGLLQPRVDLVLSGQSGRGVDFYRQGLPSPSYYGERGAVMLQVTVPLYPGPGDFARLRQDREQVLARIAEQGNAGNRAAEEASVAMSRLITARQLIDVSGRAVQAEIISVQVIVREIEARRRQLQDQLFAEQFLLTARVEQVAARAEEASAAFNLLTAIGALSAKSLDLPVPLFDPEQDLRATSWRIIGLSRAQGRR
jgi:outer membrane protein TolC